MAVTVAVAGVVTVAGAVLGGAVADIFIVYDVAVAVVAVAVVVCCYLLFALALFVCTGCCLKFMCCCYSLC